MKVFSKLGTAFVAFVAVWGFVACSSEPKSVEYYKNNPDERNAKVKECKDKEVKFSLENMNLTNKEMQEAFKKSLGKTLAQECENAINAR